MNAYPVPPATTYLRRRPITPDPASGYWPGTPARVAMPPVVDPVSPWHFTVGRWSAKGRAWAENTNAAAHYFPPDPRQRLHRGAFFAVADGVGAAGKVLAGSRVLQTTLSAYYRDPSREAVACLLRAVQIANLDLVQIGASQGRLTPLCASLAAAVVLPGRALVAAVGDCRAYLLRPPHVWRVTRNQSPAAAVSPGRARSASGPCGPALALGQHPSVQVDLFQVPLQPGDALVLVTNGVADAIAEPQLATLAAQPEPSRAAWDLATQAAAGGHGDNATAVVVRVQSSALSLSRGPVRPDATTAGYSVAPAPRPSPASPAVWGHQAPQANGLGNTTQPVWVPLVEVTTGVAAAGAAIALMLRLLLR